VVGCGYGVRSAVAWLFTALGLPGAVAFTEELPVFFLALTISALVRRPLRGARILDDFVAREIRRLSGIFLEVLIIAALASLSLRAVFRYPGPFLLLMVVAAIWCVIVLFYFTPRMLPRALWRDLGLLNYGMSTGTTALGLLLLRSYRGHISPDAARVYGLAAPFSAPFVGGGVLSLLLPQFTARGGAPFILVGLCVALVVLYFVGRALAKQSP
jgi:glutamate:Na+ symporter, ESS family